MSKYQIKNFKELKGTLPRGWYREDLPNLEEDDQLCISYYSFGNGMGVGYWHERSWDEETEQMGVDDIDKTYTIEGRDSEHVSRKFFKEELKRRSSKLWKVMYETN